MVAEGCAGLRDITCHRLPEQAVRVPGNCAAASASKFLLNDKPEAVWICAVTVRVSEPAFVLSQTL